MRHVRIGRQRYRLIPPGDGARRPSSRVLDAARLREPGGRSLLTFAAGRRPSALTTDRRTVPAHATGDGARRPSSRILERRSLVSREAGR